MIKRCIWLTLLSVGCAGTNIKHEDTRDVRAVLRDLRNMPTPERFEVTIGGLALEKRGSRLVRRPVAGMRHDGPTPDGYEPPVLPERELNPRLADELWRIIRAFDFSPYHLLEPNSFRPDTRPQPSGHYYIWDLDLSINGRSIIHQGLGGYHFVDQRLKHNLDQLALTLETPIHWDNVRTVLARKTVPHELSFHFGECVRLARGEGRTVISLNFYEDCRHAGLPVTKAEIEKLAKASRGVEIIQGDRFDLTISEVVFKELWKHIRALDIPRLLKVKPEDFDLAPQPYLKELMISVDDTMLIRWGYVDRVLKPSVAGGLKSVNELLVRAFWRELSRRAGTR